MQKFSGKKHNKEQSSNEIIKDNNITPNSNNEQMVNENKPNNFNNPLWGNKTTPNNFDDQPIAYEYDFIWFASFFCS